MAKSITVDVGARTVAFEEGMLRAANSASKNMSDVARSINGARDQIKEITGVIGVFGGALAALGGIAVLKGFFKETLDAVDALDDLSQQTGIAHEALAGLAYSANLSGTNIEGVASSVSRLSKNMAEAASGSARQAAAFSAVGVSVKEVDGSLKSTDKIIEELSDKFAGYADGPAKAALAQELFGKSGVAMVPLLNQGSEAIAQQREEALKYSGITKEVSVAASDFNDELDKIKLIVGGVATSITASLLPSLKGISDRFVWLRDHGEEVKAVLIGLTTTTAAFAVGQIAASGAAGGLAKALLNVSKAALINTAALLTNPFTAAAVAVGAAAAALYYYRDASIEVGDTTATVGDVVLGAWESAKNGVGAVIDFISGDLSRAQGEVSGIFQMFMNDVGSLVDALKWFVNTTIAAFVSLGKVIGVIGAEMVDRFLSAFTRMKNLAVAGWDGIKKVFSGDFSFSAFSEVVKQEMASIADFGSAIKDVVQDSFSTDYVGNFASGTKEVVGGIIESLAIAGQEARKVNEELTGGQKGDAPLVQNATAGAAKITASVEKQIAAMQAGYDALFATIKSNIEREQDMLAHSRDMGLISEADYIKRRGDLQRQAAEANVKRLQETYTAYATALNQLLAAPVATQDEANKRTEKAADLQSKMLKVTRDLEQAQAAVGDVVRKNTQDTEKYYKTVNDQVRRITQQSEDYARSLKRRAEDLRFEATLIGKSTAEQEKLRVQRELQLQLAEKIHDIEEKIEYLRQNGGDQREITAYLQSIADARRATAEALQELQEGIDFRDWTKDFEQISQSLTDALMRGFESGKDFAQNFKDTLISLFQTMVLRPIIQAIVQPIIAGAAGGMSGGGAGYSVGGGMFGGNGLGSLFQMGQNVFGMFGSGGGGIFASGLGATFAHSGVGQMLGLSTEVAGVSMTGAPTTALSGAGMGIGSVLGGAGMGYGIGSLIGSLGIGHGQHGGTLGAVGGAIGSIWGPIGTVVGSLIGGLVGSLIGRKGGDKQGGFAASEGLDVERYYTPDQMDKEANETLENIEEGWKDVARSLGLSAGNVGFGIGFDTDPKGDADNRVAGGVYVDGQRIYFNREDLGRDGEDFEAGIAREIQRMMLAAARSVAEGDIKDVLGDFDIASATLEEVQQAFADASYWQKAIQPMREALAITFGQAFQFSDIDELARSGETLEQTMTRLTTVFSGTNLAARIVGQSVEALFGAGLEGTDSRESLAARFGGADAMASAMSYYAQNFRPEDSSQWAMQESGEALRSIFSDIGMAVPRTREEFDALVQGLDLTSASAQETFTKLMNAAPAFNELMGAVEDLSKGMDLQIADMRRTFEMGGLDKNETYAYLKKEGDAAFTSLQSATSIDDINKYFEQAAAALSQSFSMLDDEGKRSQRSAFLAQLDELEAVKNERIEAAKDILAGPSDAITFAGNAVAQALADIAAQLGVDIDLKPFTDVASAAETVTSALENIGFDMAKPLAIDLADIDLLSSDSLASAVTSLRDTMPALDNINKIGVEAQENAGNKLMSAADDMKVTLHELNGFAGRMEYALANIRVAVQSEVVLRESQVGNAY